MNPTVLLVDDDIVARMVLMHMVSGCGQFDIHEAQDGDEAWRLLSGGLAPALVLCDLRMPGLSGIDLLCRVRGDARLAQLPFVLVSAAGDEASAARALDYGASAYLVKPLTAQKVQAQLAQFTGA